MTFFYQMGKTRKSEHHKVAARMQSVVQLLATAVFLASTALALSNPQVLSQPIRIAIWSGVVLTSLPVADDETSNLRFLLRQIRLQLYGGISGFIAIYAARHDIFR